MQENKLQKDRSWIAGMVIIIACLSITACEQSPRNVESKEPARVENIDGSSLHRLILTKEAVTRLDIKTDLVKDIQVNGAARKAVPYSAIIYDPDGGTWVYVNTEPFTYLRAPIKVDSINGDTVYLSDGPATQTPVVIVGVSELYGTEFLGSIEP